MRRRQPDEDDGCSIRCEALGVAMGFYNGKPAMMATGAKDACSNDCIEARCGDDLLFVGEED